MNTTIRGTVAKLKQLTHRPALHTLGNEFARLRVARAAAQAAVAASEKTGRPVDPRVKALAEEANDSKPATPDFCWMNTDRRNIEPLLRDPRVERVLNLAAEQGWEVRWNAKPSCHWEFDHPATSTWLVIDWGLPDKPLPEFQAYASIGRVSSWDDARSTEERLEGIEKFLAAPSASVRRPKRGVAHDQHH